MSPQLDQPSLCLAHDRNTSRSEAPLVLGGARGSGGIAPAPGSILGGADCSRAVPAQAESLIQRVRKAGKCEGSREGSSELTVGAWLQAERGMVPYESGSGGDAEPPGMSDFPAAELREGERRAPHDDDKVASEPAGLHNAQEAQPEGANESEKEHNEGNGFDGRGGGPEIEGVDCLRADSEARCDGSVEAMPFIWATEWTLRDEALQWKRDECQCGPQLFETRKRLVTEDASRPSWGAQGELRDRPEERQSNEKDRKQKGGVVRTRKRTLPDWEEAKMPFNSQAKRTRSDRGDGHGENENADESSRLVRKRKRKAEKVVRIRKAMLPDPEGTEDSVGFKLDKTQLAMRARDSVGQCEPKGTSRGQVRKLRSRDGRGGGQSELDAAQTEVEAREGGTIEHSPEEGPATISRNLASELTFHVAEAYSSVCDLFTNLFLYQSTLNKWTLMLGRPSKARENLDGLQLQLFWF